MPQAIDCRRDGKAERSDGKELRAEHPPVEAELVRYISSLLGEIIVHSEGKRVSGLTVHALALLA